MKKIAVTGLSGVIGKILAKKLPADYEIIDLYHKKEYKSARKNLRHIRLDLLRTSSIKNVLEGVKPDVIIHLAAITHIDRCEEDKRFGKKGEVWKINVNATGEIVEYAKRNKTHLIFLSTECVFDGKNKFFQEKSEKNPINWYGLTKSRAEDLVLSSGARFAIIRSVVAYHKNDSGETIYGKMLKEIKKNKITKVVSDQLFTPTYTYDIVYAINKVIDRMLEGVFHVVTKKMLSPYDLAVLIAESNNITAKSIIKTSIRSYYDVRRAALRLNNACLKGDKTNKILEFIPRSPEEVL